MLLTMSVNIYVSRYEWIYNGGTLFDQNVRGGEILDGDLYIKEATGLHEGYYQCVAFNQYGKALGRIIFLQRAGNIVF